MNEIIMRWLLRRILLLVPYYRYTKLIINLLTLLNKLVMGENRGILTKADEKWLAKFMDAAIKLKGFMELIDGGLIRVLLTTLDNIVVDKYISDEWQNPIERLIQLGKDRDKEGIAAFLDEKIDLPFIDNFSERIAFQSVVNFIAAKMYSYIDSVDVEGDTVD